MHGNALQNVRLRVCLGLNIALVLCIRKAIVLFLLLTVIQELLKALATIEGLY